MTTLFAFLHHLAAFTLVSALAVELVLLRQELTLAVARRLPIVDAVLGVSAGILLVVGLLRVFYFEKGADYYFHSHAFHKIVGLYCSRLVIDHTDRRIPVVEEGREKRASAGCHRAKIALSSQGHSWRVDRSRHHPSVCRHHGAGRVGVTTQRRLVAASETELLLQAGINDAHEVACRLLILRPFGVEVGKRPGGIDIALAFAVLDQRCHAITRCRQHCPVFGKLRLRRERSVPGHDLGIVVGD